MTKKEDDKNIVFSCTEHGKETYFKIKSQEKELPFSNFVYVWFTEKVCEEDLVEKMWVQITDGTQKSGVGKLNNIPTLLENKKLGDKVVYHTDPDGITREV
jgi:uncharacterized protein YegJ (DUF2314 family)